MPSYKSCLNDNMSGSRRLLSPTTSSGDTAFPWKLHKVLEEATWHGFTEVISWQGNNAFKVHDPIAFEESIMKRYFNQTQYKSFQRQLNIYGFERIKQGGKATGCYTHPLFIRGNPDACSFMIRTKVKKKGSRGGGTFKKSKSSPMLTTPSKGLFCISDRNGFAPLPRRVTQTSCTMDCMVVSNNEGSMNGFMAGAPNETFDPRPYRMHPAMHPSMHQDSRIPHMIPYNQDDEMGHLMRIPIVRDDDYSCKGEQQDRFSNGSSLQRIYSQPNLSSLSRPYNVELDLDTIFDVEDESFHRIKDNYRSKREHEDNDYDVEPVKSNNTILMPNGSRLSLSGRNFAKAEDSILNILI